MFVLSEFYQESQKVDVRAGDHVKVVVARAYHEGKTKFLSVQIEELQREKIELIFRLDNLIA